MQMLINWLWQGSAVAGLTLLAVGCSRRLSATTRYRLLWVGLAWVLLTPLLPLTLPPASVPSAVLAAPTPVEIALPPAPDWAARVLVVAWVSWIAAGLWRLFLALVELSRLRRSARPFPPERQRRLAHWLAVRPHGRRAGLAVSDRVPVVSVLGLGAPLIAVSPRVLAALDDEALDQVLLHEWAHVQRRDDLARLVQAVVRAVAGFHPGVWALNRRLEIEREVACDDQAANATGNPRRLAQCLTHLASLPAEPAGLLTPGALSASALTTRVVRLLDGQRNRSTGLAPVALGVGTPAIAALALMLGGFQVIVHATSPPLMTTVNSRQQSAPPPVSALRTAGAAPQAAPEAATGPAPLAGPGPGPAAVEVQPGRPADAPARGSAARPVESPAPVTTPLARLPRPAWTPDLAPSTLITGAGASPPGGIRVEPVAPAAAAADGDGDRQAPWTTAADAGIAVGRGSQKAATATAHFFTTMGRRIAGRF